MKPPVSHFNQTGMGAAFYSESASVLNDQSPRAAARQRHSIVSKRTRSLSRARLVSDFPLGFWHPASPSSQTLV
jgi:hypothetical protein